MIKRIALWASISLFFSSICGSVTGTLAEECKSSYMFRGISCEEFKETISHESLYVTFTEKPLFSKKSKCWTLLWNGVHVLLPHVDFEDVHVKKSKNGRYELFLKTTEGIWISCFAEEDTLFKDVFAVMGDSNKSEISADGVASTNRMYGGPVALSDLMTIAYENTPDQITCCKENYVEDISVAISMILKKMTRLELVAAFKGVGDRSGWIIESKGKQLREYELNILDSTQERIFYLTYRLPENGNFHDLPFRVGGAWSADGDDVPPWLEALNLALASSSDEDWRRYAVAARQIGISEKSISGTLNNLKISSAP